MKLCAYRKNTVLSDKGVFTSVLLNFSSVEHDALSIDK